MHVRSFVLTLLVVAGVGLAGCAGTGPIVDKRPDLPAAFPNHSLAQIQERVQAALSDTLRAYRAKASLSVRTPEQSGNLTADVQHRRSDSLYMSLSPGLGIEAARVLITPDSFFVYDRIKQELNYGSLDYAATILPLPLEGDETFRLMLGLGRPAPDVAWQVDADGTYYHLRDADGRRHYIIDPTVWRVVRYEERNDEGALVEARTYTDFDTFDGLYLPRRLILQRPLDDTNLTLYYRDLTLNPEALAFTFDVKDSVKRVLVDELQRTSQ